jgi:hydrophobic/amphiphilic exporter-1 (mainly G- bacteria), HAE1 family
MSLAKTVVSRPTTVVIIFAILAALGWYATRDLPLDLLPDIELPYIVVNTSWTGAGPEEVERRITRPLESVLSSVSGIDTLSSTSSNGSSQVMLQLVFGSNLDEAMSDIRAKLDFVKSALPDDATTPMVFKLDPNMMPIIRYAISGSRSAEELRDYAETLSSRLEQIDGVAAANVSGGRERAILVEIPRDRLQAYNLTITQIAQLIGAQNVQIAGGSITENDYNYTISTVGEYRNLDDIRNTVVSWKMSADGANPMSRGLQNSLATIRLRDIADVYEGYKAPSSTFYLDGVPCVELRIQKQSGKNSVQTARLVQARMEEIRRQAPSDITITETQDTTKIIQRSVDQVSSSAITGAIFAILVLFIFLRSGRSTMIIGLTIPISLVITLGIMFFTGQTLNIMTLAGLALGVGMLVDNSIVILENIYSYREKGAKAVAAAILGSKEMLMAITASTLTTICVFLPLLMYRRELGIIGEIFQGLAFTVVVSLVCSLVVAIILVPVLASKYFRLGNVAHKKYKGPFGTVDKALGRFFAWLDGVYSRAVRRVLHHKALTIGVIVVLFAGSLALIPATGFIFMPAQAVDAIVIDVTLPVGSRLENTEGVLRQLEQIVRDEVQGFTNITLLAGTGGAFRSTATNSYGGRLTVALPPVRQRIDSEETIREKLRRHFGDFPGATIAFGSSGGPPGLGGGSSAISIKIKSESISKGRDTATAIRDLLLKDGAEFATEPTISLRDGLPQANIVIDRERLYQLGLNIFGVGSEIRANIAGTTASRFRRDGIETDIVVALAERDKTRLSDLEQIFVTNNQGTRIPLADFARYEDGVSPISISRENQSRIITVNAGSRPGASIDKVQAQVEALVAANIPQDPDVSIEYGGDFEALRDSIIQFAIIIIMAIILVFAVMASQFESFLDPLIVLFTLPLTIVGVVLIHLAVGQPLNVITAVGMLILVGLIVNNGIVLVDYTNLLRKRGHELLDACVVAARSRLRPILMTTLTTVLGLVPMAFFPGEGSEMVMPIGRTVLGGLSFGTLMTLFLMPVLYYLFNNAREKRQQRRARRQARKLASPASLDIEGVQA